MENYIPTIVAGFLVFRLAVIGAFAYLIYRVLRPEPKPARIRVQSRYASERAAATRYPR